MALSAGTRLGHYDVTALIGEGGMGQVALKILPTPSPAILSASGSVCVSTGSTVTIAPHRNWVVGCC